MSAVTKNKCTKSYTEIDCVREKHIFAEEYSKIKIEGIVHLEVRDLPDLIKKYVKGNKALDYGCGAGKSTRFLKSLGLNVDGVDINPEMIEIAKQKDPNGKYKTIESGEIPYPDEEFDFVYSAFVVPHVSTKTELIKIATEVNRVLKPQGIFIMVTNSENFINNDWLGFNTQFEENANLKSGSTYKVCFKDINLVITNYFWTEQDNEEMLRSSGMSILEKHYPLGKDSDGFEWKTEKIKSPTVIHVARKNNV